MDKFIGNLPMSVWQFIDGFILLVILNILILIIIVIIK